MRQAVTFGNMFVKVGNNIRLNLGHHPEEVQMKGHQVHDSGCSWASCCDWGEATNQSTRYQTHLSPIPSFQALLQINSCSYPCLLAAFSKPTQGAEPKNDCQPSQPKSWATGLSLERNYFQTRWSNAADYALQTAFLYMNYIVESPA